MATKRNKAIYCVYHNSTIFTDTDFSKFSKHNSTVIAKNCNYKNVTVQLKRF